MNKILRMAFVAAITLMSANTFAQTSEATFSLYKMLDNGWTLNQSLDGVTYSQKSAGVTIGFEKGDGDTDPIFTEYTTSNNTTSYAAQLNVGNKLTLTSDTKTFTKIVFGPSAKAKSPKDANYEMTEGEYIGVDENNKGVYTWTGRTSNFFVKNLNNKGGMQFIRVTITCEDGATGIKSVYSIDLKDGNKVYDISGKYIGKDAKSIKKSGVYVVNGKKTMIKK